jgi:hypothetical protein
LLLKLRWARWLLEFSKWWLTVHSPPWLVVGLWGCLSSPVGNWVNHLVDSSPNVWSHFLVSDIFSVLVNMLLVKGRWESNLGSIWDERLLGSVPVDSINHGVGKTVDFSIDTIDLLSGDCLGAKGFTDVSVVSSMLIKRSWESNLGSVRDEGLLRSWPVNSINVLVSEVMNISINSVDTLWSFSSLFSL